MFYRRAMQSGTPPQKYRFELKYPRGVTMTIAGGHPDIKSGVKWIGNEGWVWVDRGGFDASNPAWKLGKYLPREMRKVKLYTSSDHMENFLDCIRTRQPTVTPVEVGHNSALPGHLCLISMLTGRKIQWDAKEEQIVGDPEASKLMMQGIRRALEDELSRSTVRRPALIRSRTGPESTVKRSSPLGTGRGYNCQFSRLEELCDP